MAPCVQPLAPELGSQRARGSDHARHCPGTGGASSVWEASTASSPAPTGSAVGWAESQDSSGPGQCHLQVLPGLSPGCLHCCIHVRASVGTLWPWAGHCDWTPLAPAPSLASRALFHPLWGPRPSSHHPRVNNTPRAPPLGPRAPRSPDRPLCNAPPSHAPPSHAPPSCAPPSRAPPSRAPAGRPCSSHRLLGLLAPPAPACPYTLHPRGVPALLSPTRPCFPPLPDVGVSYWTIVTTAWPPCVLHWHLRDPPYST